MRKTVCLLLTLLFLVPALCAAEETAPKDMFTEDEFNLQTDLFLQSLPENAEPREEEGVLLYDTGNADVVLAGGERPAADAVIEEARMKDSADNRGLTEGSTIEDVLTAYPNDNPLLKGTESAALLYMETDPAGKKVRCGYADRSGQRINSLNYAEYTTGGSTVSCKQITYNMDGDIVSSVCMYNTKITPEEMNALLNELSDSKETGDFIPSPVRNDGKTLPAFRREDLIFSGMDLMDLTPELSVLLFGEPAADVWLDDDGTGWLRICEWTDIRIVFHYSADKSDFSLENLTLMSDALTGPRGVCYGDSLYSVMHRFRFEGGSAALYGNAPSLPYGEIARIDDTSVLRYAAEAEGKTVILCITFFADRVCDILLSVQ